QVARALGAAHVRGIIHRDLKLDNVMVVQREDGSDLVKVLDFGISKVLDANDNEEARKITQQGDFARLFVVVGDNEEARKITQQGVVLGTPDYMSPEQVRGESVDHRADIYAFGIVAYEVVIGVVPFIAPNMTGVLMKQLTDTP